MSYISRVLKFKNSRFFILLYFKTSWVQAHHQMPNVICNQCEHSFLMLYMHALFFFFVTLQIITSNLI